MTLKQVLKQTGSYGRADVSISVGTPLPGEEPHFLRMLLDVITHTDDGLPPWIQLAFRSHVSRENPLCFSYGTGNNHGFSQLERVVSKFEG